MISDITQQIKQKMMDLKEEATKQPQVYDENIDINTFILKMSAFFIYRRVPGINEKIDIHSLYECKSEDDKTLLKEHLNSFYEITDYNTFVNFLQVRGPADVGDNYRDFISFWDERLAFDLNELQENGKAYFEKCMEYATIFREVVGYNGFDAWDYDQRVGVGRLAYACGILSEEEFYGVLTSQYYRAMAHFDSWSEYGLSYLAGAAYFMYQSNECDDQKSMTMFDMYCGVYKDAVSEQGAWYQTPWPAKKEYHLHANQIQDLLSEFEGPKGCIVSDQVSVEGRKVGYMYREEPNNPEDSGWMFLSGDETQDYLNDINHAGIFDLNTVVNWDRNVLPLLNAPVGTKYLRDLQGNLRMIEEDDL